MSTTIPILVPILLPLPFLAAGTACFYAGRKDVHIALASRRWPSAAGVVQSVTPITSGGSDPTTGETHYGHRLYVRYFFDVKGRRHWGDWKTPVAQTPQLALAKCEGLQEGAAITIHYCPSDPHVSVAKTGLTLERLQWWLMGGIIAFVPLLISTIMLLFPQPLK